MRLNYLVATCVLALTVGQANADTYEDFNASGIFTDVNHDAFSLKGIIEVDASIGIISNASLSLVGEPWINIINQGSSGVNYDLAIQTTIPNTGCSPPTVITPNCYDTLELVLSVDPSMLVANGGGLIVSGSANLLDAGFSISLEPGTGILTTTPLPGALPLFATGLGAIGLFGWRKKRKSRALT
jgi:hypothetical protein